MLFWRLPRRMSAIQNVRTTFHVRKCFHATMSLPHSTLASKTSAIVPFFYSQASHLTCQLCSSSCLSLPPFCLLLSACRNPYFHRCGAERAARMPRVTAPTAAWERSRHCCNTDFVSWFSSLSLPALLNCTRYVKPVGACFYCRSCGCQPAELIPFCVVVLCRWRVYCLLYASLLNE